MKKKIVTLLLAGMLATFLTACGGTSDTIVQQQSRRNP